jgi:hypothetical protein
MEDKHKIYSEIKKLLYKYHLNFKTDDDYQAFIKDLTKILDI